LSRLSIELKHDADDRAQVSSGWPGPSNDRLQPGPQRGNIAVELQAHDRSEPPGEQRVQPGGHRRVLPQHQEGEDCVGNRQTASAPPGKGERLAQQPDVSGRPFSSAVGTRTIRIVRTGTENAFSSSTLQLLGGFTVA